MSKISQHPILLAVKNFILKIIDFFYPLFRRFLPINTYRYLVSGGTVTVLGLFLYFIGYNFVFPEGDYVYIGPFTLTRYIAAYVFSFCFSFPIGFFLSKYIVFSDSYLKGRIQLFRYGLLQAINIFLNWSLLHLFVGYLGFWATPSQTLTAVILAIFSYFFQRHVSFKKEE